MLDVVIPILNYSSYTRSILLDILNNSIHPKTIFIINNNSSDDSVKIVESFKSYLNIKLLNLRKNIGVNSSWNIGLRLSTSNYISILNNDLVLNKNFFYNIIETFNRHTNCGMLCPKTLQPFNDEYDYTKDIQRVKNYNFAGVCKTYPVPWRQGWAFTVRQEYKQYLKIPKELFNYCGDDYHFLVLSQMKKSILLMEENIIFHYNAITGRGTRLRDKMFEDNKKWRDVQSKLFMEEENDHKI